MSEEMKLKLKVLKVQSFVTQLNDMEKGNINGAGVPGTKGAGVECNGDTEDCPLPHKAVRLQQEAAQLRQRYV